MWLENACDHPGIVRNIAANMRDWDRREIFATRRNDDVAELAREVHLCGPISWVAGLGSEQITAFGCAPMWPGVWSMWLFATDEFPRIGLDVTRLITRSIVPMLFDGGAHRLECRSMEGHDDAQRWLEVIGATREATLRGYGRSGEDFHVYTWARS